MNGVALTAKCFYRGSGIVNKSFSYTEKRDGEEIVYQKAKSSRGYPYVSSQCILHEVLPESPDEKSLVLGTKLQQLEYVLHPKRILRGHAVTVDGLQRKGALHMTNAYRATDCDPIQQVPRSKGGMGGVLMIDEVERTHLCSELSINLSELQFVCADQRPRFGAVDKDSFRRNIPMHNEIRQIWESYYPNTPFPEVELFNSAKDKSSFRTNPLMASGYSIEGFKISNRDVGIMVADFIESMMNFDLKRSQEAYLKFDCFSDIQIQTDQGYEPYTDIQAAIRDLLDPKFEVISKYAREERPDVKQEFESRIKAQKASKKTPGAS